MQKKYLVTLTDDQREQLRALLAVGTRPTRTLTHARLLLKAEQLPAGPGWSDAQIATALEVSRPTVERVRKRFVTEGLAAALHHRPPRGTKPRTLDGAQEAHLVALTCSTPPAGQERWTLRLLADKLVELAVVERISHETVRQTLKKTHCSPGARSSG